jgi:hypothetical protein
MKNNAICSNFPGSRCGFAEQVTRRFGYNRRPAAPPLAEVFTRRFEVFSSSMIPETEVLEAWQKQAVRAELEEIVSSHHFSQSRRYPAFLRFIVEAALRGETELLRERVIGTEVFGRASSYDTNADPIVRMTAAEVRKRIAQYYRETSREDQTQIEVRAGSYVPIFIFPGRPEPAAIVHREVEEAPSKQFDGQGNQVEGHPVEPISRPLEASAVRRPVKRLYFVPAIFILLAGLAAAWFLLRPRQPLDEIWAPLFEPGQSLTICAGQPQLAQNLTLAESLARGNVLTQEDVLALIDLVSFLQSKGHKFNLKMSPNATLADLRAAPVVLVGGLNNQWTLRALSRLRLQMKYSESESAGEFRIFDRQNPEGRVWKISARQSSAQQSQDYALIARFIDQETGQPTIIAAGLGGAGTDAAVEYLTHNEQLQKLIHALPAGKRNFEAVLGSSVVKGNQGQPQLLAVESW